jgi:hypothetical protein
MNKKRGTSSVATSVVRTFILAFFAQMTMYSCTKEVGPEMDRHTTFIKTIGTENEEYGNLTHFFDNGNTLIGGVDWESGEILLYFYNEFGELLLEKQVETNKPLNIFPLLNELQNGNVLISSFSGTDVVEISPDGEIINQVEWLPNLAQNFFQSGVLEGADGDFYVGFTNGAGSGWPSQSFLYIFDDQMNRKGAWRFSDTLMQGKVIQFKCVDVDAKGQIWFTGSKYTNPFWQFSDPMKNWVGVMRNNRIVHQVIDSADDTEHDKNIDALHDGTGMVIMNANSSWFFDDFFEALVDEFELLKIDDSLDIVWRRDIRLTGAQLAMPTKINTTPDGGYMIVGGCRTKGSVNPRPFFMKLNSQGVVVLERIFEQNGQGVLYNGKQDKDGYFTLVGATDGFGFGRNKTDIIFLKTDKYGNMGVN